MHELGIVIKVIDQIEDICKKQNIKEVDSLLLEIGEVSTVVPELFQDCFEYSKKKSEHLKNCKLELVILNAISYCNSCKKSFDTVKNGKICPYCKSEDTYLVTGNEITIKNIKVIDK